MGIAKGAALSGNLAETTKAINAAPARQRDGILIDTLAANSSIPSNVRSGLEQQILLRAGEDRPLNLSPDAMVAFARGGLQPALLTLPISRLERGRKDAQMAN